ncbi:hypothetical protein BH24PSE2_BH24PSE2_08850 [soil metagenome]
MTTSVRFHSHACLGARAGRDVLLTDPWLFGKVFHRTWALRPPPDPAALDLASVRHVWISHAHPDHLHIPSLRRIQERRARRPLTIYYRKTRDHTVRDLLVKGGFEVVELEIGKETPIADRISLTVFPTEEDSAVVIRLGDCVILNQNDCSLSPREIRALRRKFPRIDAWFFQFSLAGYYANRGDEAGLEAARRFHLELVEQYYSALQPRIFVPFASFFYYCKESNAFLNDWAVTPAQLVAALPNLPVQVLRPGDELLWRNWEERNRLNLEWWESLRLEPMIIEPHAAVPERAVLRAADIFAHEMRGRDWLELGKVQLAIEETGRALALDFRRGSVELLEHDDPGKLVISAPAEELLFFFKSPHGADVQFGSCFEVYDAARWWRLRRLRSARGGRPGAWRRKILRRALRERFKRWFRRLKLRQARSV